MSVTGPSSPFQPVQLPKPAAPAKPASVVAPVDAPIETTAPADIYGRETAVSTHKADGEQVKPEEVAAYRVALESLAYLRGVTAGELVGGDQKEIDRAAELVKEGVAAGRSQTAIRQSISTELGLTPAVATPANGEILLNGNFYSQLDSRWSGMRLGGGGRSLGAAGCALTSTAMALSAATGTQITPAELLRSRGAFSSGGSLNWSAVGMKPAGFSLSSIDAELAQGRPVVVGVDYKAGSRGGANGTDHWMTINGRGRDERGEYYTALDPASTSGEPMKMYVGSDGQLRGGSKHYTTTGTLRVVAASGSPAATNVGGHALQVKGADNGGLISSDGTSFTSSRDPGAPDFSGLPGEARSSRMDLGAGGTPAWVQMFIMNCLLAGREVPEGLEELSPLLEEWRNAANASPEARQALFDKILTKVQQAGAGGTDLEGLATRMMGQPVNALDGLVPETFKAFPEFLRG